MRNADRRTTVAITEIALAAAILSVCAMLTVPTAIPFTLQTFGICLVLEVLGGKRGTAAILVYLTLGAVGVPVFSGFRGGLSALLGPTGGYLLGFVFCGLLDWLLTTRVSDNRRYVPLYLGVGTVLCYLFGTVWYVFASGVWQSDGVWRALTVCVLPFLLPDLCKLLAAHWLAEKILPHLPKT